MGRALDSHMAVLGESMTQYSGLEKHAGKGRPLNKTTYFERYWAVLLLLVVYELVYQHSNHCRTQDPA